jgi:hypothetical protein
MANVTPSLSTLRPSDLQDPTLFALNNNFYLLNSQMISSQNTTSSWTSYGPAFSSGSLALSSFTSNECLYQQTGAKCFLNIDITLTVSGTGNSFSLAYPAQAPPALTTSYGNVLACVLLIGGSQIGGMARVTNGAILVQRADAANIAAGTVRVLVTGFYRTSS